MSRDINPFGLRMPVELRAQITNAAADNGRSLNSEIVARLQESFDPRQGSNRFPRISEMPEELQALMNSIVETMVDNIIARAKGEPRKDYGHPHQPPA